MHAVLMPLAGVTCSLVLTGSGREWFSRVIAGVFVAVLCAMVLRAVITWPAEMRRWRERDRQVAEYIQKARAYYRF